MNIYKPLFMLFLDCFKLKLLKNNLIIDIKKNHRIVL